MSDIALTFDDGPTARGTERILEVLRAHAARATFFLCGRAAARRPALVRRIDEAGHLVGNHSYSHSFWRMLTASAYDEVLRTEALLWALTGKRSRLFRPPYGLCNPILLNRLRRAGFTIALFDLVPWDWVRPGEAVVASVEARARDGSIVVLHDHEEGRATLEALPVILERLSARGFRFVGLDDLRRPDLLKGPLP
ncbi:MAG TPA: polysaccharide deacetylase family protein [Planctomycetota bacterium]|nr:polysaccharide deacetylase family protein [Planctomycetota bacterium]